MEGLLDCMENGAVTVEDSSPKPLSGSEHDGCCPGRAGENGYPLMKRPM